MSSATGTGIAAKPHVHVLLSTHNGARYLKPQLESVLSQEYPRLRLWVRDDGSTDETSRILDDYARIDARMHWTSGRNIGVVRSYFELMRVSRGTSDYYALCDQDDIWLPDKVSAGVAWLQTRRQPEFSLYCSALRYVDAELSPIRISPTPRHVGFGNALVDNVVTGCTAVFGDGLRTLSVSADPQSVQMHDWWLYLLASAYGEIGFDPQPRILYRQHGANASAWEASYVKRARRRLQVLVERLKSGSPRLAAIDQAAKLLMELPAPPHERTELLEAVLRSRSGDSLVERLRLVCSTRIRHNQPSADLAWRLLLLLGWH